MKKIFVMFAATALLFACGEDPKPATDENESNLSENQHMYGESFDFSAPVSVASMATEMKGSTEEKEFTFKGKIIESCAVAGCWMTVDLPSGEAMRVAMGDHAFAVPLSGVNGMDCIVNGKAMNTVTSVEEQRHYLEDANRPQEELDAITEPKEELAFVATGVIIEGDLSSVKEATAVDHEGHDHDHEGHDHDHEDHEGHDHEDHEEHDHEDHEGHDH